MKWGINFFGLLLGLLIGYSYYATASIYPIIPDKKIELINYFHPVHISYTYIEFNKSTNKFEILFKLFVDDFDEIITKKYGKILKLANGEPIKNSDKTIDNYIFEHFKLIINGKDKTKSELKFLKMEIKEQSIWLFYDFSFKGNCNTFDLQNSLMTDLYQDQTNLLIFSYKDEQKALKFNLGNTMEQLTF